MGQLMGINGEKILFWTRIVRDLFRINETMRESDLSLCPFFSKSLHNPNKCLTFAALEPPSLLTMLKSGVVLFLYHYEIIVWQAFYAAWWYGEAAST